MTHPRSARTLIQPFLLLTLFSITGCYRYGYVELAPGNSAGAVALDTNLPAKREIRWSLFWGIPTFEPLPIEAHVCDNKGAGKVVVESPWYGVPVMLVSLGIAAPARVTVYCNCDSEPDVGP